MYDILLEMRRRIQKKHVIIAVFLLVAFVILFVFLRGGFVIINSPENTSMVGYYQKSGLENAVSFTLKENSWKLLYLENGNYTIEAVNDNSESLYYKSIRPFSYSSINVSFKPQRNALNLGYQNSDCIIPSTSQQEVWFSCEKAKENDYLYSLTQDGINYESKTAAPAVSLYQEGVLELKSSEIGADQFIHYLTFLDDGIESNAKNGFAIKNSGVSTNSLVTDTYNNKNPRFAYFDDRKNTIALFDNFKDNRPFILRLEKYIQEQGEYITKIKLSGDKLYVFNGANSDTFMGHNEKAKEFYDNQTLSVINLKNDSIDYQLKMPENLLVTDYYANNKGLVTFSAIDTNSGDKDIYQIKNKKITPLNIRNGAGDFCIFNNDIYYTSDIRDGTIYQHNTSEAASFLVYKNDMDSIAGVQCSSSGVYFYTLSNSSPGSDYRWFKLENSPLGGVRVESVMPIIDDTLSGIDYAYPFKDTLIIKLKNDGSCGVTEEEREAVKQYLRESDNIPVNNFGFNISKEC